MIFATRPVLITLRALLCGVVACASAPAWAEGAAGSKISNIAALHVGTGPLAASYSSNEALLTVAERLDVTLAAEPRTTPPDPNGPVAVPVLLTNGGNGGEAFDISATPAGGASIQTIAIDVDGDGQFDPAKDNVLTNGQTPALAAGATVHLLIVFAPGAPADATASITATAATGSGAPGTVFAGRGDGGGDAVTGSTGAKATLTVSAAGNPAAAAPTLVKTQTVVAPDGSAAPVRDAIVTYALEARFAGAANAVTVDDPIPSGTDYVPGTLRLDGLLLSDAADGDAGGFDGTRIIVSLGDIPGTGTRTVQFKVKIK